jgi:hypothetical protein
MLMNEWALYPVFVATGLSVLGWAYYIRREHDAAHPVELSKFAVRNRANTVYYRTFMWLCPLLFAVTGLWYVWPSLRSPFVVLLWLLSCVFCMLAGVFLPRGGWRERLHDMFAYGMGLAMLALAFGAAWSIPRFSVLAWLVALAMAVIAIVGPHRRSQYIFYEVAFIYLSHFTMILIALAVK